MYVYNIELCLKIMSFLGLNPTTENHYTNNVLFLVGFLPLLSMSFLPFSNLLSKTDFEAVDVILAFGCFGSYADCAVRMLNLKLQRNRLQQILFLIQKQFWVLDKSISIEERQKHEHSTKNIIYTSKVYGIVLITMWFFYWFQGFISKGTFSEEAMPVPSYKRKWVPWYMMFFYMVYTDVFLMSVLFISDTLIRTFLSVERLQLSLLNYRMRRIFDNDHIGIKEEIKSCAQHLNVLMIFRDLVHDLFSKVLLYYMAMVIVTVCMQMFVASYSDSKDARWGALEVASVYAFQFIFIYCHPAQQMLNEVDELPTSLYLGNWKNYPKFYRDVILLLGKSQQKFYLSAGGLIDLNYESGVAAFKSMFSYFAFLRTMSTSAE